MRLIPSFRLAVRRLRRAPGFTGAVLLTLTLAIGTLVAAFTVTSTVVLKPLPYPESERLVEVGFAVPGYGYDEMPMSDAMYLLVQEAQRSFTDLAMYQMTGGSNLGEAEPERVQATEVTPGFFRVFGREPAMGRAFTEEEARPGGPQVLVISDGLWERRWGRDPEVIGTRVVLEGSSWEIIGVAPEGFRFPDDASELWTPLRIDEGSLTPRGFAYPGVARLEPDVPVELARTDLDRVTPMAMETYPDEYTQAWVEGGDFRPYVEPLHESVVGDAGTELYLILGTAGLLLLLALANVANLFVVRAEARSRELALRSALGAGQRGLHWNLLGESLALAAVSGVLGLGLASLLLTWLKANAPEELPRVAEIGLGPTEVGLTALVVGVAALVFALLPGSGRALDRVGQSLRVGGRSSTASGRAHRVQTALVVGQVGLAVTLLVGAGLLFTSFGNLSGVDPGFDRSRAVTFELGLPRAGYDAVARRQVWSELEARLREMPDVEGVGGVTVLPLDPFFVKVPFHRVGREAEAEGSPPMVEVRRITPGYFEAVGMEVVEGRGLVWDDGPEGMKAAVVNETLARTLLSDAPAPGREFRIADDGDALQVVGVVRDVHTVSLDEPPEPEVYLPVDLTQRTNPTVPATMQFVLRSGRPLDELVPDIREAVAEVDAQLPVANMSLLSWIVDEDLARERFLSSTLLLMAATGLLLALVGVYGLIAYVVSGSRREIGIRTALGEPRHRVWGRFVLRAVTSGGIGAVAGLLVAGVGSRYLESLLYETGTLEPTIYIGTALALISTAGLAAFAPAWRATRIDPSSVLREE